MASKYYDKYVLLKVASSDEARGIILVRRSLAGTTVSSGEVLFADTASHPRILALWDHALRELLSEGYIQIANGSEHTTTYLVTHEGYQFADIELKGLDIEGIDPNEYQTE